MSNDQHELLYRAFLDSIKVLGVSARQAIIEDLNNQGIDLQHTTIEKLAAGLRQSLGDDAATLITAKIVKRLDDWFFVSKNKK